MDSYASVISCNENSNRGTSLISFGQSSSCFTPSALDTARIYQIYIIRSKWETKLHYRTISWCPKPFNFLSRDATPSISLHADRASWRSSWCLGVLPLCCMSMNRRQCIHNCPELTDECCFERVFMDCSRVMHASWSKPTHPLSKKSNFGVKQIWNLGV